MTGQSYLQAVYDGPSRTDCQTILAAGRKPDPGRLVARYMRAPGARAFARRLELECPHGCAVLEQMVWT